MEQFYNATGGQNWASSTGWLSDPNHCNWIGIECNDQGDVTAIELRNNSIAGEFPAAPLSALHKLEQLDLAYNGLSGTLADPPILRKLMQLAKVDLSQNKLDGDVDVHFAPALESLILSDNNFSAFVGFHYPDPSGDTLRLIDLSHNSIRNAISDFLANLPTTMKELLLSDNEIAGEFPHFLGYLASMQRIRADQNALEGTLPDFSAAYPNIEEIDLSRQREKDGDGLTGAIPASLFTLPFLSRLNLAGNRLSKSIPSTLGNIAQLKELDLSDNKLNGSIPPELGQQLGSAAAIVLSSNEGL